MIGTRYITKDRKPLQTLLPLESPLVLFVDPCDACCLACNFCPTGDTKLMRQVKRPLQSMNMFLFKKIIRDLDKFESKIKVLRLYLFGEPLMNKNFCEMVKLAKQSDKIETVDTTTNGILLNKELNIALIDSGIDRINISVNGLNDLQYKKFTNRNIDFNKYVANIKHLYENRKNTYIFIKICGDTISPDEEKSFLDIFEPIADSVAIERNMSCWKDFELKDGLKPNESVNVYNQPLTDEALVCSYTQYSLSIQSDGRVSSCFLDWSRKLTIGDISKQSLYSIWNGDKLKYFQIMMLEGKRKSHPYCSDCDQLLRGNPSNIDKYAKEILERRNK